LRSDDGVGTRLAEWAEERFRANGDVRVVARQQWTPDLAEDIAAVESVLFVDSSIKFARTRATLTQLSRRKATMVRRHITWMRTNFCAGQRTLRLPIDHPFMLLTVGAGSTELARLSPNGLKRRCQGRAAFWKKPCCVFWKLTMSGIGM